ncbi:glycosyltransferase family 4 protein [Pedobacter changchengzhani]|uniref:Glycosyltransferase family 4 protein n=1 Tax=Pedobacter changchengzhani TaxID=2529274 RepID=A0A4R5MJM8_9SPHI|nr:glycosyltransferase family 4 protein [Pedobacter changchengzhani]TDG35289.1 glycosyltransferase family 4 protein [Pedobacter changchengzhani]
MKIAIIADPELPVPPLLYGGIERIISMLIEGYIKLGHKVSLFAHPDSNTSAKLFAYSGLSSSNKLDVIKNTFLINRILIKNNFDIVHSFGRLAYLLPQLPVKLPKLMSYQREPSLGQIKKAITLSRKNSLSFTGCSAYISNQISPFATSYPIFNGVDLSIYDFVEKIKEDAPLVFLGRIEPIKGTHIAIKVAQATNKRLIIAGNIPAEYQNYFEQEIKPYLSDTITYIGPVNDSQKNKLLGSALAFLMPIEWNEPFGIVMAEAMACGTPVIAFNRGSVPEIVINGINGFSCNTVEEMIGLIGKVPQLNRQNIRRDCEERFSSTIIINHYLELYQKMIDNNK